MTEKLADKKCIPCQGGVPPLELSEKEKFLKNIDQGWEFTHDKTRLARKLTFKNFKSALAMTNQIGEVAEEQMHHPDLELGWGYLNITVFTHKIQDLVESDFIFAAKVDQLVTKA